MKIEKYKKFYIKLFKIKYYNRFEIFFRDFSTLINNEFKTHEISIEKYSHYYKLLYDYQQQHIKSGVNISIWDIAGISKNEIKNSAILAWLLDYYGSHGQKSSFMQQILKIIYNKEKTPNIDFPLELKKEYKTRIESSYEELIDPNLINKFSRVDIEIDGPELIIFFEIKINAGETNNQIERYLRIAKIRAGKRPWRLIFITTSGKLPKNTSLHKNISAVSWKDISNFFSIQAKKMPEKSFGRTAILQFCDHIKLF